MQVRRAINQIYVMAPDGSNLTNISNTTFKDNVWSWPSASQLLFSSTRARPEFDIYRMQDDGSGVKRLNGALNTTPDS